MNTVESEILKSLLNTSFVNQRVLAEVSGFSLGMVNKSIKNLISEGYLDNLIRLTDKAKELIKKNSPKRAIILAAGTGMRMVPVNTSFPKALLEVNGEKLIERLIRQLHEAGIKDITVVVGFMKESFEYLIDEYGVKLKVNADYFKKNNLHTLNLVRRKVSNCYIVPCDIWCADNPFSKVELYSWYMVSDNVNPDSCVRVNRKNELVTVHNGKGNGMVGIAYITEPEALTVRENLEKMDAGHPNDFWESTLIRSDKMIVSARIVRENDFVEINTYEQLRTFNSNSNQLKSDALSIIAEVFGCDEKEIVNIETLKKGMTNRSFLFSVGNTKYVMRIPGEGTGKLINRRQEAEVYQKIQGLDLSETLVYINPDNGYKITEFLNSIRVCDTSSESDLRRCMKRLRSFHEMKLSVQHEFDIFAHIELYESFWEGKPSVYGDYTRTKENVYKLRSFVDGIKKDRCLTHIDAVPDNFLFFTPEGSDEEKLILIDWEYSGMQDPHVDIAMFCIYSLFDKEKCDHLIDIYFENKCGDEMRAKIYCYIAMCGLLWSNWCEYKAMLGIEFGEYSLCQYHYAKEFYRYATELIGGGNGIG